MFTPSRPRKFLLSRCFGLALAKILIFPAMGSSLQPLHIFPEFPEDQEAFTWIRVQNLLKAAIQWTCI